MSAPFFATCSKNQGVCFGCMSRSPSRSMTYSPVDAAKPAFSAAPLPPFLSQKTGLTTTWEYCLAAARRMASAVPSAEPSSTGTSSARMECESKSSAVATRFPSMVAERLYTGITTERRPVPMVSRVRRHNSSSSVIRASRQNFIAPLA